MLSFIFFLFMIFAPAFFAEEARGEWLLCIFVTFMVAILLAIFGKKENGRGFSDGALHNMLIMVKTNNSHFRAYAGLSLICFAIVLINGFFDPSPFEYQAGKITSSVNTTSLNASMATKEVAEWKEGGNDAEYLAKYANRVFRGSFNSTEEISRMLITDAKHIRPAAWERVADWWQISFWYLFTLPFYLLISRTDEIIAFLEKIKEKLEEDKKSSIEGESTESDHKPTGSLSWLKSVKFNWGLDALNWALELLELSRRFKPFK